MMDYGYLVPLLAVFLFFCVTLMALQTFRLGHYERNLGVGWVVVGYVAVTVSGILLIVVAVY